MLKVQCGYDQNLHYNYCLVDKQPSRKHPQDLIFADVPSRFAHKSVVSPPKFICCFASVLYLCHCSIYCGLFWHFVPHILPLQSLCVLATLVVSQTLFFSLRCLIFQESSVVPRLSGKKSERQIEFSLFVFFFLSESRVLPFWLRRM